MRMLLKNTKEKQKGFTLVEIMIVVAILGILGVVGSTLLVHLLPNMRLRSATRDIYSALMTAKTESVRLGENVTLLFDSPNSNYTMFIDTDTDNTVDPGETVIIAKTTLPTSVSFDPDYRR